MILSDVQQLIGFLQQNECLFCDCDAEEAVGLCFNKEIL